MIQWRCGEPRRRDANRHRRGGRRRRQQGRRRRCQGGGQKQEEFRQCFGKGKISGEVKIEGERASVPILFGPEGTKPETLEMVKVNGLWYLASI